MSILLRDLLDKYEIDYSKFPKGILGIKINGKLEYYTDFTKENQIYVFTGEYPTSWGAIAELEVKINLKKVPSRWKLDIVNDVYEADNDNIIQEKYGLTKEELRQIFFEVLGAEVVTVIKHLKDDYTDYKTYNIFGR